MISRKTMYFVPFILCFLISSHVGNSEKLATNCDKTARYNVTSPSGSLYLRNMVSLFSVLASNASRPNGFFNYTAGGESGGQAVYGLFLCRGDVAETVCQDCLDSAVAEILQRCSNVTRAVTWYDDCMLRYSNLPIFSKPETNGGWLVWETNNVTDGALLNRTLGEVFNKITNEAAYGDVPGKKFSVAEANFTAFAKIFAMGQCTPDLSNFDCEYCLRDAVKSLPECCNNRQGGYVLNPSCYIRYSTSPFYHAVAPPPLQPTPTPPPPSQQPTPLLSPPPPQSMTPLSSVPPIRSNQDGGGISTTTVAAIVSSIAAAAVAFVVVFFCIARKRNRRSQSVIHETSASLIEGERNISTDGESLRYNFSQIQVYTKDFAAENMIGQGGYGPVYKGKLPDGQIIAVKRLSKGSTQGGEEFINEIALVAKLQHRNLVRLLGYCLEGEEKILIYEFVTNKSLDYFLFDPEKQPLLDWLTRYNIIRGIARGLLYLHEDSRIKVVHRDLKAGNVLLDQNMNAKIADFGMAKLFEMDQSERNTSKIAGTFGYMAPEYVSHGMLSVKSDVFSFGVLVLEIISGKMNSNLQCFGSDDLLTFAWKQLRDGTPLAMADPAILKSLDKNEVIRCIHIGLLCVVESMDRRPTMASVGMMLNSNSVPLPTPNPPAFFGRDRGGDFPKVVSDNAPSNESSSYSQASRNVTFSIDLYPR